MCVHVCVCVLLGSFTLDKAQAHGQVTASLHVDMQFNCPYSQGISSSSSQGGAVGSMW